MILKIPATAGQLSGFEITGQARWVYDASTLEMGQQIKITNKTGAASVKGNIVEPSSSTDRAVGLIGAAGDPDPIGIVYEAGIADGSDMWVWCEGSICEIYFIDTATHGQFARTGATSDTGETAGQAVAEAVPSSPFATDKHFQEVGHVLTTHSGAGLALCWFHTN
jgi:hypothetical protein